MWYQTQTIFLNPFHKCLPLDSAGHWQKVSNNRKFLRPRWKTPLLALATPPIHDKDTKSSKNESKLRQRHLWDRQGNIRVVIGNLILCRMLYILRRPRISGSYHWSLSTALHIRPRLFMMEGVDGEPVVNIDYHIQATKFFQSDHCQIFW